MNQEVLWQFSGDWSKFDKQLQERNLAVDKLAASANRISFGSPDASKYDNFKKELGGINTSLSGMRTRLSSIRQPLNELNSLIITSTDLINKYDKSIDQLVKDLYHLANSMLVVEAQTSAINRNISTLNKTTKEFNTATNNAGAGAKKLGTDVNDATGFFGQMGGSIQRLIPFLSALFVLNTVKDFLLQLYEINRQFELFELKAKSALYGSKLLVQEYYEILKRIDLVSLFDIEELEDGLVKLLNRRVNLTEQQLLSLANTAQSVGTKGAQSFNQIVDALLDAQVGQFRRLEELGVGVDATGEKLKLTFAGVTTEVDKGAKAVVDYILQMDKMNGATNFAAEASNTLEGRVSSLKTKFDELILALGKAGATDAFSKLIQGATEFVEALTLISNKIKEINDLADKFPVVYNILRGDPVKVGQLLSDEISARLGVNTPNTDLPSAATTKEIEEYKKTVIEKLNTVNKEFNRLEFPGTVFQKNFRLDVSKLKTNDLKQYVNDLEAIIAQARKIGIGEDLGERGKALKETINNLAAVRNEIASRPAPTVTDDKTIAQQERLSQRLLKIQQDELETQRNLYERRLELEKKYLNDRLRFLEQGSVEYLQLKKEIDLKEIELDKQRSLEIVRVSLVRRTINKRGVEEVVNPTEQQVNTRFKELGFEKIYQESRLQVEEETNEAIVKRRQSFYESIESALENSLNREIRTINRKYDEIQKTIDKAKKDATFESYQAARQVLTDNIDLQISGTTVEDLFIENTPEFLSAAEQRVKALREYEIAITRLRNSQVSPETAGKSVQRDRFESRETFRFRSQLAQKQQELSNEEQMLGLVQYLGYNNVLLADNEFVQEFIKKIKDNIAKIQAEIDNLKINARKRLPLEDKIISQVFKIQITTVKDDKTGEIISETISDQDRKAIDAFKNQLGDFLNYYNGFIDSLIAAQQRREDAADKSIDDLKSRIAEEQELRAQGLSNTTDALQAELDKQQQIKADAQQKQISLQKQQIIINGVLQASTLGVAVANLYAEGALKGPVGIAIATASALSMLAIFAGIIAQLKALPQYEKGGIIGFGESHANGGSVIEAEKGEFVINKKTTSENRTLVENINNFKGAITSKELPKILSNTGIYVNESSIENGRELIRRDTIIRENNIMNTLNLEKQVKGLGDRLDKVAENTELLKTRVLMDSEDNIWEISENKIEKTKTKP